MCLQSRFARCRRKLSIRAAAPAVTVTALLWALTRSGHGFQYICAGGIDGQSRKSREAPLVRGRILVMPIASLELTVRVTATFGTPLPLPSSNFTWTAGLNVAPAVTVAGGCWEKTTLPGVPGVFVSWNGTENAPTPAVAVKAPAVPLAVIGAAA